MTSDIHLKAEGNEALSTAFILELKQQSIFLEEKNVDGGFVYLFNGISTSHGLFNTKIRFICK